LLEGDGEELPLAEVWSAAGWSALQVPLPSGVTEGSLDQVSCATATSCTALGVSLGGPQSAFIAETWNGVTWTGQVLPGSAAETPFALVPVLSMSCASASACMAMVVVGPSGGGLDFSVIAEHLNAGTWSSPALPLPSGATGGGPASVSCPAANSCAAVGDYDNASDQELPLVEGWNGTSWTAAPLPVSTSVAPASLTALSCPSLTACTAVGAYDGEAHQVALQWNGSTLSLEPTATIPGAATAYLNSISCPASSACAATGLAFTAASSESSVLEVSAPDSAAHASALPRR